MKIIIENYITKYVEKKRKRMLKSIKTNVPSDLVDEIVHLRSLFSNFPIEPDIYKLVKFHDKFTYTSRMYFLI